MSVELDVQAWAEQQFGACDLGDERRTRRAVRMADRLQAGTVWVNTYRSTSYTSPFGGYKASGLGRENGVEAIKEYLQVKSVWLYTGGDVANPFIRR